MCGSANELSGRDPIDKKEEGAEFLERGFRKEVVLMVWN